MSKKEVATKETKKEFTMKPVFKLWLKKSKAGNQYLSGVDESGKYLTGFLNGKKENPKEPDIRLYESTKDGISKEEYTSLWSRVSKNGNKYFTGKLGETWLTGFINKNAECGGKIPYITVYFQAEEVKQETIKEVEAMSTTEVEVTTDSDLPF